MKKFLKFEPIASLTASQGLTQAVLLLVAKLNDWGADILLLAEGIQGAAFVLVGTFFRSEAVSKAALEVLDGLSEEDLAKLARLK